VTRRTFLAVAPFGSLAAQEILTLAPAKANARLPYGKEAPQFGDLYLPSPANHAPVSHPTVVMIHGGYWKNAYNLDIVSHLCAALANAGAAVWSLEYRRLGDPGGNWAGMADDIIRGAEHLVSMETRYSLDLTRTVVVGHSAGGQLALWLAAQRVIDLRGVVPLAGVSDLRRAWALQLGGGVVGQLLGGSPERVPQRYAAASPAELLPISVPQRLVHGTADIVIPFEMSQRFVKASGNAKLIPVQGVGHFDLIDPHGRVWPTIQRNILEWQF
jgi:acetyl esterase/lipase